MSTKIYNGFIFNKINTLEKAFAYLKKVKPDMEMLADHYWLQIITELAVSHYDFDCIEGKDTRHKGCSYFSDAFARVCDEEKENNKEGRASFTNIDAEIAIAPVKVEGKNRIVGIPVINNKQMLEQFKLLPEIDDYCYYDNTDEPDYVTKKEFKARGKTWDIVFKDNNIVSQAMLTYTLVPEGMRLLSRNFIETNGPSYIKSYENRVESCTREYTVEANKSKFKSPSDYFKWVKTDEYKNEIDKNKELITSKLDKNLTLDKLREENNANRTNDE